VKTADRNQPEEDGPLIDDEAGSVPFPVDKLIQRLAATELAWRRFRCRIAEGDGIPTVPALPHSEQRLSIRLAMQCDRAGGNPDRRRRQHDVLRQPTGIELIATGLGHDDDGGRRVANGIGEVATAGDTLQLIRVLDDDE